MQGGVNRFSQTPESQSQGVTIFNKITKFYVLCRFTGGGGGGLFYEDYLISLKVCAARIIVYVCLRPVARIYQFGLLFWNTSAGAHFS